MRVFSGRNSVGVRGINLAEGDKVISMAILSHVETSPEERLSYIKRSIAERRAAGIAAEDTTAQSEEEFTSGDIADVEVALSDIRYADLSQREQTLLTVSEFGYGKRSSSYEFRISKRGGKGIRATDPNKADEIGNLVAAFPVEEKDQIMLVSDGGQLIRVPVAGIRIAGRATKGVTIFNTAKNERVVSVEHISECDEGENSEAIAVQEYEANKTPSEKE
ncbi:DNA gyrase C-terminal beta-propeller domain-containing protein [Bartonella sp. DGB2]|uniref:DNA gyrase C-terminal beta-propeller domain-containing protein n=1 Tax=Bartonella sp. DGB2 TaxID=3388426 RepID=UPI00398FE648